MVLMVRCLNTCLDLGLLSLHDDDTRRLGLQFRLQVRLRLLHYQRQSCRRLDDQLCCWLSDGAKNPIEVSKR